MRKLILILIYSFVAIFGSAQNNVADEIAWVVGDEPIFKSDIEQEYQNLQYDRQPINGNPYCVIPERLAINKLFLHQAKLDSIEIPNSSVIQSVDARINYFIANLGSKEKVEEYFRKPMAELREQLINMTRDQYTIQQVQSNLTKTVKATPAEVQRYFNGLSSDSLPYIPRKVEVQIITVKPHVPQSEIDSVKSRLREYAREINDGEKDFSTLAILYSQDASSIYGGEIGFKGRTELYPEYATAAFNLSSPNKVSQIVQTDDGFHIIQLIEKRGDRINTRHILLKPTISPDEITKALAKLDTLRTDIVEKKKITFETAAMYVSEDKDSRNNNGIMLNEQDHTSLFEMAQLPSDISKVVDTLSVGSVSAPFVMVNSKTNAQQVAIVKLLRRIDGHTANLAEDYQTIKDMYEMNEKNKIIENWIKQKQQNTYVYIEEGWRDCDFQYDWLKRNVKKQ